MSKMPETETLYCRRHQRECVYLVYRDGHHRVMANDHILLWGSASAELKDSASAVLWGSASAVLWGSASAVLWSPLAVCIRRDPRTKATGRLVVDAYEQSTEPRDWLAAVGAKVKTGKAVLYKRVAADYLTRNDISYVPGTEVEAPDWDGGIAECGGGLHFVADPRGGDMFRDGEGDRYVACEVALADIVVHARPDYPDKVKARRCRVLYEVDRNGKRIKAATP